MATCEVCGCQIRDKPFKAVIGGAKMMVCRGCSKLGSVYWEAKPKPQRSTSRPVKPVVRIVKRKASAPSLTGELELVVDFGQRVRKARLEAGLTQEDLGRKIREKVSVLRKVETGKMTPDNILAKKLEHALNIKLLVPPSEPKASPRILPKPHGVTLGELVHLKKEEAEETEKREPS